MTMQKYSNTYHVRSYECDRNNNLRLVTLMNIFQDMAVLHADAMGLGFDYCLSKGLAWVGSNYEVQIERLPKMNETITINTWPAVEKKAASIRDFEVFAEDGTRIIAASSQWVLISIDRKRPVSLKENLQDYSILEESVLPTEFNEKIDELARVDEETKFRVRFDDIDLNRHVNNAVYALWASEAVDPEFRLTHTPYRIEIQFRKEGLIGEKIMVSTECNEAITSHSIKTYDGDNRELARARIEWKPLVI